MEPAPVDPKFVTPEPIATHTAPKRWHFWTYFLVIVLLAAAVTLAYLYLHTKTLLQRSQKSLSSTQTTLSTEQQKVSDIAFGVYPEQTFMDVRNQAFHKLAKQAFPGQDLREPEIELLRVFNTSDFRSASPLFKDIQNDDIVVYYDNQIDSANGSPSVVVRPREKRVIAKGMVNRQLVNTLRSNNITFSLVPVDQESIFSQR